MKNEIIRMVNNIENQKILGLVYGFVKAITNDGTKANKEAK